LKHPKGIYDSAFSASLARGFSPGLPFGQGTSGGAVKVKSIDLILLRKSVHLAPFF
jgi:hypothetical protein